MVKDMIDSGSNEGRVPLNLVTARTLVKVIEYLKKHAGEDPESEATKEFDSEFADGLEDNQELLFDVLEAAYYLRIDGLLHLLCTKVAGMLQGKTVEEVREVFYIRNDYTPEEEEEVRRENSWAFQ